MGRKSCYLTVTLTDVDVENSFAVAVHCSFMELIIPTSAGVVIEMSGGGRRPG